MSRQVADLPVAESLPESDELMLPLIKDIPGEAIGTRKIKVSDLTDRIIKEVMNGADIEMEVTEGGIKFKRRTNEISN